MRILLVDDEPQITEFMKMLLSGKGHFLDSASNGKRGLEFLKENVYDLVFLDVNMPEITGVELIKYMNQHGLAGKKVLFTGYEVMEGFLADSLGADEYLRKPFKPADLEHILKKYDAPCGGSKNRS